MHIKTLRKTVLCTALSVLVLLFALTIVQSYRHYQLEQDISTLETQQRELFETNKEIISTIIQQRSLIQESSIQQSEELKLAEPGDILYIERMYSDDRGEKYNE